MSGNSLWAATASPAPAAPPLEESGRADVAIVGAGYTGLSAALHLAESGASVAVLDAEEPEARHPGSTADRSIRG